MTNHGYTEKPRRIVRPTPEQWAVLEELGLADNDDSEDIYLVPPAAQAIVERLKDKPHIVYKWLEYMCVELDVCKGVSPNGVRVVNLDQNINFPDGGNIEWRIHESTTEDGCTYLHDGPVKHPLKKDLTKEMRKDAKKYKQQEK